MLSLVCIFFLLCSPERSHPECPHIFQAGTHKKVYTLPTEFPQYPGGHIELLSTFHQHLEYPCTQSCYAGRIVLRYTVEADGRATDWEVIRQTGTYTKKLDSAALKAVQYLKPFVPG
ncbi:MAG: energy transducer TonB, partial [Bacteroidota bacterium]